MLNDAANSEGASQCRCGAIAYASDYFRRVIFYWNRGILMRLEILTKLQNRLLHFPGGPGSGMA